MKRIYTSNSVDYTPAQLRKLGYTIEYWVIIPQRIKKSYTRGTTNYSSYDNVVFAKTLQKAYKKLNKYNGAYIERILKSPIGKWCIGVFYRNKQEYDLGCQKLYDKYSELEPISN